MGRGGDSQAVAAAAATLAVVLVALVMATAGARAEEPENPEARAIELVRRALPLQTAGDHDEALLLLEQAARFSSHPKVLFLKARSLFALKRYEEARTIYRNVPLETQALAEDLIEEARSNLAACDELLKETQVQIVVDRGDGAAVTVDGEAIGPSPVSVSLRRGTYRIAAHKDGFEPAEKIVSVKGEDRFLVTLSLALLPVPDKPEDTTFAPPPGIGQRRAWAWITLGTGVACVGGGIGFLANYADKMSADLAPNQHVEGEALDLAMGVSLAAVGAGLAITSVLLFQPADKAQQPVGFVTPLDGGALIGVGWHGW